MFEIDTLRYRETSRETGLIPWSGQWWREMWVCTWRMDEYK